MNEETQLSRKVKRKLVFFSPHQFYAYYLWNLMSVPWEKACVSERFLDSVRAFLPNGWRARLDALMCCCRCWGCVRFAALPLLSLHSTVTYGGIWAIWNCPLSCLLPITASPPLCNPSSKTCTGWSYSCTFSSRVIFSGSAFLGIIKLYIAYINCA